AINVDQQNLAIIDSAQLVQLQHSPSPCKVMIILGEVLASTSLGESIIRGSTHKTLDQKITTVVSFSLSELLTKPEKKALAWQDLQLAKRTYLQL
ncbi:MAG: hypothetical protein GQ547_04870, partial [Methylophaga sp.]|nr:hypothetical protein [Methylophaga sp.]